MHLIQHTLRNMRTACALAGLLATALFVPDASAATFFFQTGASGGGSQNISTPSLPISGTMIAQVPLFNPAWGTLLQADFEYAGSVTGSWTSIGNPIGNATLSVSGPADVGGQPMGNISVGYVGIYTTSGPSNEFDAQYVSTTYTSGPFFNSLTGIGTVPMTWVYSGLATLDTPAVGAGNSWGASVHVLYTYDPVPEPQAIVLGAGGLCGLLAVAVRRYRNTRPSPIAGPQS
ncbi:MAG: hypothetical protein AB7O59_22415 [Pirellulales bacterium]